METPIFIHINHKQIKILFGGIFMLSKDEIKNFQIDPAIKFCYDYILPISQDRVLATHGEEISMITSDGTWICTFDSIQVPTYPDIENPYWDDKEKSYMTNDIYIDNFLIIIQDGLYGIIDYDGEIVVPAVYNKIEFINETEVNLL